MPMPKGSKHSEETKRKISEAHKGHKYTEETKQKMSKAKKGENNPMYGIHRFGKDSPNWGRTPSEETKRKISEAQKGEKGNNWKGGIKKSNNRIFIYNPGHPRTSKTGYVHRSHLVAEKKLGRYLKPEEVAHHKNGIKDDDRPENIEVITRGKHTSFHNKNRGN